MPGLVKPLFQPWPQILQTIKFVIIENDGGELFVFSIY